MIRAFIAAATVTLSAAAPSFAAGYDSRTPYFGYAAPQYDDSGSRVVVDSYAGRVAYEQAGGDHCAPRRRVIGWTSYSRRIVRPAPNYDY
jgi:hypothetical protein